MNRSALYPGARGRGLRLITPLLGLGAVTLVAAACGGGGSSAATSNASTPAAASGRSGGAGATNVPPGTFGTVAAVSGDTLQVQSPTSGQVAVDITPSTVITETVAASASDLAAGECVSATGTLASGVVTARSVTIDIFAAGNCATGGAGRGFGGGFGVGGGFGGRFRTGGTGTNGGSAGSTSGTRPNLNNVGIAYGKVLSISNSNVQVQTPPPPSTTSTTRAGQFRRQIASSFTYDSSTKFSKLESASSSAITDGLCVAAFGPSDNTGAVTASRLMVSQPGPNGCFTGFGRGGAGGGAGG
ncbi:MAG TPA: DUF5666 domain-containing protein [Acidimicrobiales bacterium]|nr:DUF5666 domain-containing protein [Acidimicrobiales bacterium]